MQLSGSFSELIERFHESQIGLAKSFAQYFRKHPDRLSRPDAFESWADFKIVRIEFSEKDAKLNWEPWIICSQCVNWVFIGCFGKYVYKVLYQIWVTKIELASWSAVLFVFKALTSVEEILLGNPRDFTSFHRSLGLPIDSLKVFSEIFSFYKKYLIYFISCHIINIFVNV